MVDLWVTPEYLFLPFGGCNDGAGGLSDALPLPKSLSHFAGGGGLPGPGTVQNTHKKILRQIPKICQSIFFCFSVGVVMVLVGC